LNALNRYLNGFVIVRSLPRRLRLLLPVALLFSIAAGVSAYAIVSGPTQLAIVRQTHSNTFTHTPQDVYTTLLAQGRQRDAFIKAVFVGDTLFATHFNALDGGGANVGNGERYTRTPRADLLGEFQWGTHRPFRATGPNAAACADCHNTPAEDGAGQAVANVHRDPEHSGLLGHFIQRNTPHIMAMGPVQKLAEEMTIDLQGIANAAKATCLDPGCSVTKALSSKGISFGSLTFTRIVVGDPPLSCTPADLVPFIDEVDCNAGLGVDTTAVTGVAVDLVVRPFQWKGAVAFIRDFNRDASHNELGMGPVEVVGDEIDNDFDGVKNELLFGDETGLTVYAAALPRPTSRQEINALHVRFPSRTDLVLDPPFTSAENASINRGSAKFAAIGCASCHIPSMTVNNVTFTEPSQNINFRDKLMPAGQDPIPRNLDPARAVRFNLTTDTPFNNILDPNNPNHVLVNFGALETGSRAGSGIARIYGDLKRHDMGPGLAEQIDELKASKSSASTWLTENLWGVGSTPPYLHDGRATTLSEAIIEHGGEGQAARDAFIGLSAADKTDVITFLNNLIIFRVADRLEELAAAIQ
jgi:hypothetical protein